MSINTPLQRAGGQMPRKKSKRITISSKRQISIPKEFYDELGFDKEIIMEVDNNKLVLRPVKEGLEDFSEEILAELIKEGYEGYELLTIFKERKAMVRPSLKELINETKAQDPISIDDLFSDEENNE